MQASPLLEMAILLIGSLIVIWIGIGLMRSHDTMDHSTKVDVPILKVITTACVVTWFNPQALIDGKMCIRDRLRYDTTFGRFPRSLEVYDKGLVIDGKKVPVYSFSEAVNIPWKECGAEYIVEATGAYVTTEKALDHITACLLYTSRCV